MTSMRERVYRLLGHLLVPVLLVLLLGPVGLVLAGLLAVLFSPLWLSMLGLAWLHGHAKTTRRRLRHG